MRNCYIPYCDLLYRTNESANKRMLFLPPKNEILFEKWKSVLPKLRKPFKRHDRICERHFNPEAISTKWDHIINGQLHQLERGKPRLQANAIPTLNLVTDLTEEMLNHELNKRKYKGNINYKTADMINFEFNNQQRKKQKHSIKKFEVIPVKRKREKLKENDELYKDSIINGYNNYESSTNNLIDILSDHIENYEDPDENNINNSSNNKTTVIDVKFDTDIIEDDQIEYDDDGDNTNYNNEDIKSIAITKNYDVDDDVDDEDNDDDVAYGEEVEFEDYEHTDDGFKVDCEDDVVAGATTTTTTTAVVDDNNNDDDNNVDADNNDDDNNVDDDDDRDDDDNTQFGLIFDDVYDVVLPNTLWGIHRDPKRKFITFSYFDSTQMRITKLFYINHQLSTKIYLCNHQLVDETLNEINTEYISNLLNDIDEYRICLDIDKNMEFCMAIANGDTDLCSGCQMVALI